MPRGIAAKVGDTNVSKNGYHYTRTETGWRMTHHIVAEQMLGRPLDLEKEYCSFVNSKDKMNLSPSNIQVRPHRSKSQASRRAKLEAKIADLQGQLAELDDQAV